MMIRILATSATIAATLATSTARADIETEHPTRDRTPAIQWTAETVIVVDRPAPRCTVRSLVQGSGSVKVCEPR